MKAIEHSYETNHKTLVMDYMKDSRGNTFFCVLANEFIEHISSIEHDLDGNIEKHITLMKIYYPFLDYDSANIQDIDALKSLTQDESLSIDDIHYSTMKLQEKIYHQLETSDKKQKLQARAGIQKAEFLLKPNFRVILSLEQIFKTISSSHMFPFIKFNPGKNQEKSISPLFREKQHKR